MSDMDKLNAKIEAQMAEQQDRDALVELLESAEDLGCAIRIDVQSSNQEIVIYTGLRRTAGNGDVVSTDTFQLIKES